MTNKTYKLSKSGVERLEQFKRDIENGDCVVEQIKLYGKLVCYEVKSSLSVTCVFERDELKVKQNAIKKINKTLNGKIKIGKHDYGDEFYVVSGGCGLRYSDVEEI